MTTAKRLFLFVLIAAPVWAGAVVATVFAGSPVLVALGLGVSLGALAQFVLVRELVRIATAPAPTTTR